MMVVVNSFSQVDQVNIPYEQRGWLSLDGENDERILLDGLLARNSVTSSERAGQTQENGYNPKSPHSLRVFSVELFFILVAKSSPHGNTLMRVIVSGVEMSVNTR
jgi:hypothetical protein